jgi:general secretion pathway protein A
MYRAFYHLTEQPFRLTPDPSFMCMTAHHQEALAGLVYSVCMRPGLTVLSGEAGTGKTMLLYSLMELLQKRQFITAICTNPVLSREELFDFLIDKFGVTCGSALKSRQLSALEDTFARNRMDGRPAVLIVDEAHRLPMELLEEIRMLLNIETPREKLLQIILAGQPELDDMLRRPDLRQLKQRVSCHCKLKMLTVSELREYIKHRLTMAGLSEQTIFPEAVIEKIHEYSRGIPRLINTLCDTALQVGFATRSASITLAIIEEAAKDLDLATVTARLDPKLAEALLPPLEIKPGNGHNATNPTEAPGDPWVPMTSYTTRQKSMGLFAGLMERWR